MLEILIVDDEKEIARALKDVLDQKGYSTRVAHNGKDAFEIVKKHRPHLVFLDIRMPLMSGLTVLRNIRDYDRSIKVIMVTAFGTKEIVGEASRLGAVDFIRKPFTKNYLEHEVMAKVSAQLFEELRREVDEKNELINQLEHLSERVSRNFYQTVMSLAAALEARDRYTHGHSERVESYSKLIAKELKANNEIGIDREFIENLHIESRLHDIGKIAIPDTVLNKKGKLTDEEYDEIKRHPGESARILAPLDNIKQNIDVIYSHHERIDGKGYPSCKSGEKIPLRARIIAVADAFDAMTSNRPYRKAMSDADAFKELNKQKDTQFDAMIVEAFGNAFKKKTGVSHKEEVLMNL
ncbi:MAG: response regulator [Candidatus Omnitrophica bacterium]|nr:response regulator [Candidatus Omnitrophota bacterium]MCG2712740.1 response regulator [Candidatus Omnitrophota bacterium]